MRFQTDLTPPPVNDAQPAELFLITTPESRAHASALAGRLRAEGFEVTETSDDSDEDPDEVAAVLGGLPVIDMDSYDELLVAVPEAPMAFALAFGHGGAFVSADADFHTEPQPFWSAVMRIFTLIRDEVGWVPVAQEWLELNAAEHSVTPDGTGIRPAELTAEELDEAVTAVLNDVPADYRLPRDAASDDGSLRKAAAELSRRCPSPEASFPVLISVTADGEIMEGVEDTTLTDSLLDLGSELRQQLGDDRTGRATTLVVHHDPGCDPPYRLEPVFDRIPLQGSSARYMHWDSHVRDMLRRAPEWQPAWLPDVTALMERAGYDLAVFSTR
ncbi:hypothetical protein [Actinomadura alba]|uniref:Uncharacterized protein n=1 Tax=Actinomadura alba TaxID=406431 RepID=A0ABR7LSE2_9ACTN|nr:hypothetical protein [Actinomadura alba]MBC6467764.1 hypothetical protein [Actinomadura alba]